MIIFLPNTHHITMAAVTVSSRPHFLVLSSCVYYCFLMHAAIHVPRVGSLSFNLSFSQPQSPGLSQLINRTGDATITEDTLDLTRKYVLNLPL